MEKLDLTKRFPAYYKAKKEPHIVDIEGAVYLAIEGKGDPSSEEFSKNIEALYSVAYTTKFVCKEKEKDFVVAKLEGLWWYDDKYANVSMSEAPKKIPRSEWFYKLLIRIPEYVTASIVREAVEVVKIKKGVSLATKVERCERKAEMVMQILHVGPFENEIASLLKLQAFADEHNLKKGGLHHEIYLSDFRRTPAEKLKTILREPIL